MLSVPKLRTLDQALEGLTDGMTLMIGGFLAVGSPETLVDEVIRRESAILH